MLTAFPGDPAQSLAVHTVLGLQYMVTRCLAAAAPTVLFAEEMKDVAVFTQASGVPRQGKGPPAQHRLAHYLVEHQAAARHEAAEAGLEDPGIRVHGFPFVDAQRLLGLQIDEPA